MAIKTITPRLPRVGTIRLGTKAKSQRGFEYPVNSEYFVFPKEGEDGHALIDGRFDEKTNVLRITFPVNDLDVVLSDFYRRHTASGLMCKGDGEIGLEAVFEERTDARNKKYVHKELKERPCASLGCPYAMAGECKPSGILSFSIDGIPALGVWHLTTHSINAIQEFKAVLQLALISFGRINSLPFELFRRPIEVNPDGRKKTVWTVGLRLSSSVTNNQITAGAAIQSLASGEADDHFEEAAQADNAVIMDQGRSIDRTTGEVVSDVPPPESDWDRANRRLRAIANRLGKEAGVKGAKVAEYMSALVHDRYKVSSSKNLLPEQLDALADLLDGGHINLVPTLEGDDDVPPFEPSADEQAAILAREQAEAVA